MDPQTPAEPVIPTDRTKFYGWIVAIALFIYAGFSSYSWKQTTDKLSKMADAYSSSVTIQEPVEVAGKIVYKTTTQTVHDVKTQVIHDKTVTTIKSGCTLGFAYSTRLSPGLYLSPDVLPFGPGNVQILACGFQNGELIGGVGYRLNF